MQRVRQVTTVNDPTAAAAWHPAAASRSQYLATRTARLLDLTRIGPGARVLAVGVGAGGEALDAALRVGPTGEVVATDMCSAMIAKAKRAVAEAVLGNFRCLVMGARRLEFPAETVPDRPGQRSGDLHGRDHGPTLMAEPPLGDLGAVLVAAFQTLSAEAGRS